MNLADTRGTAKVLLLTLISWVWPIDRLLLIAQMLGKLSGRKDPIRSAAPDRVPPRQFSEQHFARSDRLLEARMQILGLLRPGRQWRPKIKWHGLEHVQAALCQNTGAILWDGLFVYRQLITGMAFHEAGFRLVNLSRPGHGFSGIGGLSSPFADQYINVHCRSVEEKFADRLWVGENTLGDMRHLLAANRIIKILVWDRGQKTVEVPFFATGKIVIATGPVHLSHVSGAPLVPVFTLQAEDGAYEVNVGPPLQVPRASAGSKVDYAAIIRSYVELLEPYVQRQPDQWVGWDTVRWSTVRSVTSGGEGFCSAGGP